MKSHFDRFSIRLAQDPALVFTYGLADARIVMLSCEPAPIPNLTMPTDAHDTVGRVLAVLEKHGFAENTLVIFSADNAPGSAEDCYNQLAIIKGTAASARDTLVHNTNAKCYALRHGDWGLIDAKSGGVSPVPVWFDEANGYSKNS